MPYHPDTPRAHQIVTSDASSHPRQAAPCPAPTVTDHKIRARAGFHDVPPGTRCAATQRKVLSRVTAPVLGSWNRVSAGRRTARTACGRRVRRHGHRPPSRAGRGGPGPWSRRARSTPPRRWRRGSGLRIPGRPPGCLGRRGRRGRDGPPFGRNQGGHGLVGERALRPFRLGEQAGHHAAAGAQDPGRLGQRPSAGSRRTGRR